MSKAKTGVASKGTKDTKADTKVDTKADTADRVDMGSTPAAIPLEGEAEAGVYVSQYAIPHPTDSTKVYPGGGVSFTIDKAALEDPWVVMQIESGVFMAR